jgi:hypothetical protein
VTWDRDRYRREVLEPARRSGNEPPPDLYARYGLDPGAADPAAVTSQIAEVRAYWRELDQRAGPYRPLARALLTADAELTRNGPFTPEKLAAENERIRQDQQRRLAQRAELEARSATHAGPATVKRMSETIRVTEAEAAAALRQAGVRVVAALPRLPPGPHPKQAALAGNVRQLGRRLSTEVVFGDAVRGGFRILDRFRLIDGQALDDAALGKARDRTAATAHADPARAPTEEILAILGAAARRPGDLDALLLSEVVEPLRRQASLGSPQVAIAQDARGLGLDENEAGLLASALVEGEAPGRREALRRQAADALDAGRLRAAQRLARELPADDSLTGRIAAADARVAALTREADEELARGRREQAAVRLADALGMATDDPHLADRLIALPPPPPQRVRASPNGQQVVVTWESSPLLAGRLCFQVTRGQGSGPAAPTAGIPVGAPTAGTRAVDEAAPTGTELRYSVFACYAVLADQIADACSPPAVTDPVLLLTDVTGVRLAAQATSVSGSWQLPPRAQAVIVRRGAGTPPHGAHDGTPVRASLTGFTDTGLRTGTEYFYRIMVSYLMSDGRRHHSAGIVVPARPAPEPEPVTDLRVAAGDGPSSVAASWTPPPYGEVRLLAGDAPPRWRPGDRATAHDLAGLRVLHVVPRRHEGRDRVELPLPSGRHYLTPLTVAEDRVVAGNVAVAELAEPVRSLAADRMHDCARLAWEWPRGATDALVRWAGAEQRCSKRVYEDEGGVTVTIGPAETLIEVHPLYPHSDGPLTGAAASVLVPARGIAVRYRVRRGGTFRRRRLRVEFSPERETRLPAILVVRGDGRHVPDEPAAGETLLRIEPQAVTPERPLRVTVDVRGGPGWLACFTDPAGPDILLFPPPEETLRLR